MALNNVIPANLPPPIWTFPGGIAGPLTLQNGPLLFNPDNTYNIGASGASRPANIYAGAFIIATYGFQTSGANAA